MGLLLLAVAIAAFSLAVLTDAFGSDGEEGVLEHVRENRIQAVYLEDQRVYFGNLEAGDDGWLILTDAFFLRRTAAGGKAGKTDLVPLSQEVGGDGSMALNPDSVVQVQNLQARSEIARTIEDALG